MRIPASAGNLAPFSYFNVVAHNPPHVVIGFATSRERSHGRKDTLFNILDTKWVVLFNAVWGELSPMHCVAQLLRVWCSCPGVELTCNV